MARRGGRSARPGQRSSVHTEERDAVETEVDELRRELREERARANALENLVKKKFGQKKRKKRSKGGRRKKGRPREDTSDEDSADTDSTWSTDESSSESSDDSTSSEDTDTDSEDDGRKRRRRRSKKATRRKEPKKLKGKPRWKSQAYRVQYRLNERVDKSLRAVLACKNVPRKARMAATKGQEMLSRRQKWLVVADDHGVAVANRFDGATAETLGGKEALSRLQHAIEAEERARKTEARASEGQPFRRRGPGGQDEPWIPTPQRGLQTPSQPGPRSAQLCFTCGSPGHFQRSCPNSARKP